LFDFTERGLGDDALSAFLHDLVGQGFSGVNITYPFKQAVIPCLHGLSESATLVGAVNTVAMRDGTMIGHNTDMDGFRDSLANGLPGAAMDRILLLGAGGAGAAVASALLSLGAGIVEISDAELDRAEALVRRLTELLGEGRVKALPIADIATRDIDGIVNATPMGMAAHPGIPIDASLVEARHWIADIVYFPLETELLRIARMKGCRTLDGSGMVVAQAARAFEIITGCPADQERMKRSFFASSH
jgi:shikimate dehydrogenase